MSTNNIVVYISEKCPHCEQLMAALNQHGIDYETKNVTANPEYMKELQDRGVYGTPATLVEEKDEIVSGVQISKISHMLGITNKYRSYFSTYK